jgi:hypothetical protein
MSNTPPWKKNTGLFLAGQAISLFGSMLTQYAIMWEITLRMQSGAAMTLYALLGLLPTFLMSPLGGVWADRFNRKTIINLADGGIALVTLAVAIVFMGGYEEAWLLFACAGVRFRAASPLRKRSGCRMLRRRCRQATIRKNIEGRRPTPGRSAPRNQYYFVRVVGHALLHESN